MAPNDPCRVDLGRLSIAGFVNYECDEAGRNWNKWPNPLLLLDGREAIPPQKGRNHTQKTTYWSLSGDYLTGDPAMLSSIFFPQDGREPFAATGNWPGIAWAHIFEPPVAYTQEAFEESVQATIL